MFSPNLAKSNDTCRIEGPPASSITTAASLVLTEGVSSRPRSKRRLTGGSSGATKQGQGKVLLLSSSSGESDAPEEGKEKSHEEVEAGGVGRPGISAIASVADVAGAVDAEDGDSDLLTDDEGDNGGEGELTEKRAGEGGKMRERSEDAETEGSEADIDSVATSVSGVDDAQPRQKGSPIEAPLGGSPRLASVVVKGNPKVIQAHATRFPMLPPTRPPRAGKWASPIESPSSSRESVAELLATGAKDKDASDYAEVPMTPSRVPVRN